MMAQLNEDTDKAKDLSRQLEETKKSVVQKLASLAGYSERLDTLQRRLDETLLAGGGKVEEELASIELSQSDFGAIRIRQEVSTLEKKCTRTFRLLTYSIVVDESLANQNPQIILNSIEKVVYKLDPEWFTTNTFVRTNRDDNFQFTITVWGITRVGVEIHFPKNKIVTSVANMNLFKTTEF